MKIELIKQIFNNCKGYKFKPVEWCCDELKENPYINLSDEEVYEEDDIPQMTICESETINDWGDTWVQDYYYPIRYCPFCGKPIQISIVKTEDVSDVYTTLTIQRDKTWEKCQETDSKTEERRLRNRVQELDNKIDWLYSLNEYRENKND